MPEPSILRRTHRSTGGLLVALAAALATTGCASIRLADARAAYFQNELSHLQYQRSCEQLWGDVLRLLASKGYPLEGRDREYSGEVRQGGFAQLVSGGSETKRTPEGGLTMRTGWDSSLTRYQVTGYQPAPNACQVAFLYQWQDDVDPATVHEAQGWQMELDLLRRVDPAAASQMAAGAPKKG
jgi:hypothetical protein